MLHFCFNYFAEPDCSPLSLHDALPISIPREFVPAIQKGFEQAMGTGVLASYPVDNMKIRVFDGSFHQVDSDSMSFERSEEHTSELQSPCNIVCRLLLEKKKNNIFILFI